MNSDQIQSLIRSLLVSAGAGLVSRGIVSSSGLEEVAGAAGVLAMAAWGWWEKRESAQLTKAIATVNTAVVAGDAAHSASPSGVTIVKTS